MKNINIAFIGAGHMTRSLVGGLIANGYDPNKLWVSNPSTAKLEHLQQKWGVHTTQDNKAAATAADVVVLAVKPQILKQVTTELADIIRSSNKVIISVAAGVNLKSLSKEFGNNTTIIRCMPNTPSVLGCGATGLCANAKASPTAREIAESIMRSVGITIWVDNEAHIDIVTALSGSGPAYFFLIMEALEAAAANLGLPKEKARLLTLQTAFGAAKVALESDEEPAELRRHVTLAGGTTEAGLRVLENGQLRTLLANTLEAAQHRAKELSEIFASSP